MISTARRFFRLQFAFLLLSLFGWSAPKSLAQTPASRIAGAVTNEARATLPGSHAPAPHNASDAGELSGTTALNGMNLVFSRSSSQEAQLQQLLAAQQDPSSTQYHKWLTPEQFAALFGVSDEDIAAVTAWLGQQGFTVNGVSRSRNRITFSGSAVQAENAFGTSLHRFTSESQTNFAPVADLVLPSALASVTQNVTGLSSFRPHSHVIRKAPVPAATSLFTSSQSASHYLTPSDIKTIYDISPAYSAGYTGGGQSIAVVGQSAIVLTDIEKFQAAAGLGTKDPTIVLVPNSGTSTIFSGDESESDLDLEYSGAIATGATIKFVYVGSNQNDSVTDAETYAVDNDLAPIITVSYGQCESSLGSADYATLNAVYEQAAAQGQTIIAASGDDGSSDCAADNQSGLAVDFPASSQYVTGMGGSEYPSADVASTNTTYWTAASGSDVISSALSYIPEEAWNDSTTSGLSSGGGGVSIYTPRPTWQAGVTGIPSGSYRLVPDISLTASPANAGYLYCSSDSSVGITGSCSTGFRDANDVYLTVAGGTSFDAPIFAGMLALINQAKNATSGQGVVNSILYALASNSTTYASAFHDITSGTNECPAGYRYCSTAGESSYAAGTGYDEATGLGSVDLYKLLTVWSSATTTSSSLLASSTTIAAATTTPASGASDLLTITVASSSASSTVTPTGTVSIAVDGTSSTSAATLSNGVATYTFSSTAAGTHTVAATYSGDGVYASSAATITLTIPSATTATSSFSVAATNVSVTAGSTGTSTVTVTPAGGYTGTVDWAITSSSALTNGCYAINNVAVSGSTAVTTTLTIYTSAADCTSETPLSQRGGKHAFASSGGRANNSPTAPMGRSPGGSLLLAGVFFASFLGFRRRRLPFLAAMLLLTSASIALVGCGSTSSSASSTSLATGTYTLILTGTDSASSSLTASTNLTLSVD